MRRFAIASVITLSLAAAAHGQEIPPPGSHAVIQGINYTDEWTLRVIAPNDPAEDVAMKWVSLEPPAPPFDPDNPTPWHPEAGYYIGKSPKGMTYILDRTGPNNAWAITLQLPAITSNGACWELNRSSSEGFVRVLSGVPTSGPFWAYYGITSEQQPKRLGFVMIP